MTEDQVSKTIYEQTCEDFRSLNEIMWKVPILVMSLTGGLGVAIATFDLSDPARRAILIFIGAINVAFILVLWRLRMIMERLLIQAHKYQGTEHRRGYFVVLVLSLILAAGAAGSFIYAAGVSELFQVTAGAEIHCSDGQAVVNLVDKPISSHVTVEISCESSE